MEGEDREWRRDEERTSEMKGEQVRCPVSCPQILLLPLPPPSSFFLSPLLLFLFLCLSSTTSLPQRMICGNFFHSRAWASPSMGFSGAGFSMMNTRSPLATATSFFSMSSLPVRVIVACTDKDTDAHADSHVDINTVPRRRRRCSPRHRHQHRHRHRHRRRHRHTMAHATGPLAKAAHPREHDQSE